jgi:trigger factor
MQIEQISALERRVKISLPMAEVASEVESRLKRLARTTKMQGFRPGKVPMKLVAQNYGYQVQNEVMNEKINAAVFQAIEASQLRVAGMPHVEAATTEGSTGENADFVATFEIYPEVKFGDWQSAEVEKVDVTVSDAEVDKTVDILRKQRQTFVDVTRASKADDRVTVDFSGSIDGIEFPGGQAKDFAFVLGSKQMLPEFDAAATGLAPGESKVFPLSFPADYHGADVAGKTAEFTLTVKSLQEPQLPEVDGEFAKQLGITDGDVAKMREDVRNNLEREVRNRVKARNKDSVMNALLKVAEFEVPKSLVEQDVERLKEMAREDLKARGVKTDSAPLPDDLFKPQAEKRVRLGLAVNELVKLNDLKATQDQIKANIEEFAKSYEDPAAVMAWYLSDRKRMSDVEAVVLEDNVVNWVQSQAKVSSKTLAFEELMGAQG